MSNNNNTIQTDPKRENEVLVEVQGLGKKFCKELKTSLWYGVKDLVSGIRGKKIESVLRPKEFWAVKDINFELRRGECLGLIGHNGAGKSTLLKILNGLINPDAGSVTMRGRVCALIELGAGFNSILSGRENIYNNGAILGFSRKEIDEKLEDIIAFAELEEFIDMPVQHYSSGMKVRLGFAVAAEMEPDVLIIDEVLAVGDIGFRTKCLNRIGELLPYCVTIFVSHAMPQVARIANKILLMNKGQTLVLTENISLGIQNYYNLFSKNEGKGIIAGNNKVKFEDLFINSVRYKQKSIAVKYNEPLELISSLRVENEATRYFISYGFIDVDTKIVANVFSEISEIKFSKKGDVEIKTVVDSVLLGAGIYTISIAINQILASGSRGEIYYYNSNIASILVTDVISAIAPVQFLAEWSESN
ncbi:ATP-binding cassette domain-containing protein [Lacinutrix sp. WUR7]|uniref:ABC transporter ATP-binding protein n=1 Tax=Lacinutrix sp. WUR7 TaxID=2653681 RepID=UPI00193E3B74|nr:ABC transporter ATP-binding protein [Lacinutrix sp. WUR7]QRM87805.1 ATP-binding cassette domain-containing protein [Lacinutrix sp. WUR7]